jgi:TRAP-type C4-dicarboxylate transport system permease small subunit
MKTELVSGLVLLAITLLYYVATNSIADSTLSDEIGATGLPRALTYALGALGLLLVLRAVLVAQPVRQPRQDPDQEEHARLPRAIGFLLFGAGYVAILPILGYFVSIALLIAFVALFERAQRPWVAAVTALGGAALYWAVFVKLLGVNQPVGAIWQGLLS